MSLEAIRHLANHLEYDITNEAGIQKLVFIWTNSWQVQFVGVWHQNPKYRKLLFLIENIKLFAAQPPGKQRHIWVVQYSVL